jgi:hypothetical protein
MGKLGRKIIFVYLFLFHCSLFKEATTVSDLTLHSDWMYEFFREVFFSSTTTCPLWTSWSPLPVVAEV